MKARFVIALLVTVLIPFSVSADVSSDMDNPQLSLVVVMQNAIASGMSAAEAVTAMIAAEPSQSGSIVATAMVIAPGEFESIINAAISAGADASTVVASALFATDGANAQAIVATAISAAPGEADAINSVSSNFIASLAATGGEGPAATPAQPVAASVPQGSGGGAVATADEVIELIEIIASLSGDAPTT